MSDEPYRPVHGQAQAEEVMQAKFLQKLFGNNRKARRIRVVNRYFSKKGYRQGIKIKA